MTAWTDFVKKFYNDKKMVNPLYKFKDALMEGAKEYKKGAVAVATVTTGKPKRGKTGKKSKKSKKNASRRR